MFRTSAYQTHPHSQVTESRKLCFFMRALQTAHNLVHIKSSTKRPLWALQTAKPPETLPLHTSFDSFHNPRTRRDCHQQPGSAHQRPPPNGRRGKNNDTASRTGVKCTRLRCSRQKLPSRIAEAENAPILRTRELFAMSGDTTEEGLALDDALYALRALRNCLKLKTNDSAA